VSVGQSASHPRHKDYSPVLIKVEKYLRQMEIQSEVLLSKE